jgi:hypothetical protein
MVGAFQEHRTVDSCPDCGDLYYGNQEHSCTTVEVAIPRTAELEPQVATSVLTPTFMAPLGAPGSLGTRDDVQEELDGIVGAIRQFHIKHPDQVLRECSAYGARLTELAVLLHRVESQDRQYQRLRTMQVQKIIEEIERQFRTASRLVEINRQDLEMLK